MEAAPTQPKVSDDKKYEDNFYHTWENLVGELSDEQLQSTLYMIKHYDELNKLIKDQQRYRDNQVARDRARALSRRNRAQQYALDRE